MPFVTAIGRSVITVSTSTTARRIVKCLIGCALTAITTPPTTPAHCTPPRN